MQQGSLFDLIPADNPVERAGVAGVMPDICAEMGAVADLYEAGRKLLVVEVSKVSKRERVALTSGGGKELTVDVLDKWLQASQKGHQPSLEAIICYCLATGSARPIKPLLKILKLVAIPESDLRYLEYGKICAHERKLRKRKLKVEIDLL